MLAFYFNRFLMFNLHTTIPVEIHITVIPKTNVTQGNIVLYKGVKHKGTTVSPHWIGCCGNLTITIGSLQCCNRLQWCVQLPLINKTPLPICFHYFISFFVPHRLPQNFHRRALRLSGVRGNKAHWVKTHLYTNLRKFSNNPFVRPPCTRAGNAMQKIQPQNLNNGRHPPLILNPLMWLAEED